MSDVKVILDVEIGHSVCPIDETEETCKLNKVSEAIQQELLKARIDELELNAYYSQGKKTDPLELCGISKNADEVNERIADLQAKLKENSDE